VILESNYYQLQAKPIQVQMQPTGKYHYRGWIITQPIDPNKRLVCKGYKNNLDKTEKTGA